MGRNHFVTYQYGIRDFPPFPRPFHRQGEPPLLQTRWCLFPFFVLWPVIFRPFSSFFSRAKFFSPHLDSTQLTFDISKVPILIIEHLLITFPHYAPRILKRRSLSLPALVFPFRGGNLEV